MDEDRYRKHEADDLMDHIHDRPISLVSGIYRSCVVLVFFLAAVLLLQSCEARAEYHASTIACDTLDQLEAQVKRTEGFEKGCAYLTIFFTVLQKEKVMNTTHIFTLYKVAVYGAVTSRGLVSVTGVVQYIVSKGAQLTIT